jgi:cell division protein FtsQ
MFKKKKNKQRASAVRKNVLPKTAVPKKHLLRFAFVVLLVGGMYAGSQWYTSLQLFPVKHVRIEGEFKYLDKSKITERISSYSVGGFFDLDIVSLRNELISMQWVDDAFVRREWPESVIIRVVEKKPVAKWNDKGVLTANGGLFFPTDSFDKLQLVQLKGPENRHEFVLSEFNKIQSLLHQAQIEVSELTQNERRSWQMNIDGISVYLGRKDIYKKIESLAGVYAGLIKPKASKINLIDFRYTNGFAVSWKKTIAIKTNLKNMRVMDMNQVKTELSFLMGAIKHV